MAAAMKKNAFFALPLVLSAFGCSACGSNAPPPPTHAAASASAGAHDAAKPEASSSLIDDALRAAWQKEGITPTAAIDDAGFLRRAYLDIVGVIPSAEATAAFVAEEGKDKRKKIIDALLANPRYAEHWTNVWDRALLGTEVKRRNVDREAFRAFLRSELTKNTPWDKLVYALVTAEGKSGPVGEMADDDDDAMAGPPGGGAMMGDDGDDEEASTEDKVNGAVNWLLKYQNNPQDLAGATSRIFLGVQIQCAQCHDHKTEAWKTEDFQALAACFATTRARPTEPKAKKVKMRHFEVAEVKRPPRKQKSPELRAIASAKPKALDGTDLSQGKSRRKALAAWITAPQNPWFAKAIVNRVWAHFLGSGFVEPITDFRPSNPPALPALLDALAADFVAHGYDLQHLVRLITTSEAYQRSADKKAEGQGKLWSRFRMRPLGPDELIDSIVTATKIDEARKGRGRKSLEQIRSQLERQMSFLFDVDEEAPERDDYEGSITQALYLLNGSFLNESSRKIPGSALAEVLAMPGDDEAKIASLYRRVLSREPTKEETTAISARLGEGKNKAETYEDLLWALLNTSEFTFNH